MKFKFYISYYTWPRGRCRQISKQLIIEAQTIGEAWETVRRDFPKHEINMFWPIWPNPDGESNVSISSI